MGQYLSACLSSDATDDDAYDRRDIEFLEEQAQRILDLQCRVNEIAQPPQVLKKSSYKPDQVVTLVDGREVVIVDGKIFGGRRYSAGDDERIFAVVQSRGGSWDREDRGGPFGVAYFPSITEAQAAAKILLKDDAVRAVDAGSRYNHLF